MDTAIADVMDQLRKVMDPEIPTMSIVDLGMVEKVSIDDNGVSVDLVPTFMGCPALEMIRQQVEAAFGEQPVRVRFVYTALWTSERVSAAGRQALQQWGIAPPPAAVHLSVACPLCGSMRTQRTSAFGASLCRALFYCLDCSQPFEQMKMC